MEGYDSSELDAEETEGYDSSEFDGVEADGDPGEDGEGYEDVDQYIGARVHDFYSGFPDISAMQALTIQQWYQLSPGINITELRAQATQRLHGFQGQNWSHLDELFPDVKKADLSERMRVNLEHSWITTHEGMYQQLAALRNFTRLKPDARREKRKKRREKLKAMDRAYRQHRLNKRKEKGYNGPLLLPHQKLMKPLPRGELPTPEVLLASVGIEDPGQHEHGEILETAAYGIAYNVTYSVKEKQEFLAKMLLDLDGTVEKDKVYRGDGAPPPVLSDDEDNFDDSEFAQYDNFDYEDEVAEAVNRA